MESTKMSHPISNTHVRRLSSNTLARHTMPVMLPATAAHLSTLPGKSVAIRQTGTRLYFNPGQGMSNARGPDPQPGCHAARLALPALVGPRGQRGHHLRAMQCREPLAQTASRTAAGYQ
eukprot:1582097-Rhodomonas_salina.2